jgi:hypothetical protein
MLFARRLQFFGPIAVLLLIGIAPAYAQSNKFEFNDAHFHLTNNVQDSDRFLFGTDSAAPKDESQHSKVFSLYEPLWQSLDAQTSRKVRLQNYALIFDEARRKVRSWESAHELVPGSN